MHTMDFSRFIENEYYEKECMNFNFDFLSIYYSLLDNLHARILWPLGEQESHLGLPPGKFRLSGGNNFY